MTQYSVFSKEAVEQGFEYETCFFSVAAAKKEMKRLMAAGFQDVTGSKTKVYSNGDWEPCGEITLTGSNKIFMANTKMTKANY